MTEGYILSVTQLNEYVNTLLRNDVLLGSVSIRGEISGFKRHTSPRHSSFLQSGERT